MHCRLAAAGGICRCRPDVPHHCPNWIEDLSKEVNFRQQLAIENIQLRLTDLIQTIKLRGGISQLTTDACKAVERAVAPVIAKIGERE